MARLTAPFFWWFCVWTLLFPVNARKNNNSNRKRKQSPIPPKTIINSDVREKINNNSVEGLKNSLASGLASFCSKALLQPFDTIKTVQQYHDHDGNKNSLSLIQAAQYIVKRGGITELYAGLLVSALGGVPSIALYYGVYSYCKGIFIPILVPEKQVEQQQQQSNSSRITSSSGRKLLAVALSAAIGNTVASFSRVPYEVVKQKLQTGHSSNTFTCIKEMFLDDGIRAFFPMGGVSIQMVRDIPYAIFTLVAYEFLRDHLVASYAPFWKDMVAGASAGGFGSFMTNGLDVIKTRLQTNPELYDGSIITCAQILFQQGGWQIFLRGSPSRLLYKIPTNGVFFVFYEFFRRLLNCHVK